MSRISPEALVEDPAFDGLAGDAGYPPNITQIPGAIWVDGIAGPLGLKDKAELYLKERPSILSAARKNGQDVVAFVQAHGKEILIGTGVAALVTAGVAAVVIYEDNVHRRRKEFLAPLTPEQQESLK